MTDNPTADHDSAAGHKSESEKANGSSGITRSTIQFPYFDMEAILEYVNAVHAIAGFGSCSIDQLAGHVRSTTSSGTFRLKLANARTFGLIDNERGKISLTHLGREIVDPNKEMPARSTSFLMVPLFRALYDKYKGHVLPPTADALESEIVDLGVSAKQKGRARLAFQRSAEQAGFFRHGRNRLVLPIVRDEDKEDDDEPIAEASSQQTATSAGIATDETLHPFIRGLLDTLPTPDSDWPVHDRTKWLQTAAQIFGLIYKGNGEIQVVVKDTDKDVG